MGVVEKERRTSLALTFPNEPSRRGAILPEGTAYSMDGNRRCRRNGWHAKMTAWRDKREELRNAGRDLRSWAAKVLWF